MYAIQKSGASLSVDDAGSCTACGGSSDVSFDGGVTVTLPVTLMSGAGGWITIVSLSPGTKAVSLAGGTCVGGSAGAAAVSFAGGAGGVSVALVGGSGGGVTVAFPSLGAVALGSGPILTFWPGAGVTMTSGNDGAVSFAGGAGGGHPHGSGTGGEITVMFGGISVMVLFGSVIITVELSSGIVMLPGTSTILPLPPITVLLPVWLSTGGRTIEPLSPGCVGGTTIMGPSSIGWSFFPTTITMVSSS